MDYYKILGLFRDSTQADIRRAYRQTIQEIRLEMEGRKTRQMEAANGIQSEEIVPKLRRVHEAFSVLNNATRRKQLDAHLDKLDQNQYEKFGPSWHRWYFEDRERSRQMREKREMQKEAEQNGKGKRVKMGGKGEVKGKEMKMKPKRKKAKEKGIQRGKKNQQSGGKEKNGNWGRELERASKCICCSNLAH